MLLRLALPPRNQKSLIVDHWFLDPLRKEGLDPLIIGVRLRQRLRRDFALIEKISPVADGGEMKSQKYRN
jgi:hypothetical protein